MCAVYMHIMCAPPPPTRHPTCPLFSVPHLTTTIDNNNNTQEGWLVPLRIQLTRSRRPAPAANEEAQVRI